MNLFDAHASRSDLTVEPSGKFRDDLDPAGVEVAPGRSRQVVHGLEEVDHAVGGRSSAPDAEPGIGNVRPQADVPERAGVLHHQHAPDVSFDLAYHVDASRMEAYPGIAAHGVGNNWSDVPAEPPADPDVVVHGGEPVTGRLSNEQFERGSAGRRPLLRVRRCMRGHFAFGERAVPPLVLEEVRCCPDRGASGSGCSGAMHGTIEGERAFANPRSRRSVRLSVSRVNLSAAGGRRQRDRSTRGRGVSGRCRSSPRRPGSPRSSPHR